MAVRNEVPSIQAAQLRQLRYEIFGFGKNGGRVLVNNFAGIGKTALPAPPLNEQHAEFIFQLLYGLAHCRLCG
jgi:hypothetical protein